jgi:hypothetical protein
MVPDSLKLFETIEHFHEHQIRMRFERVDLHLRRSAAPAIKIIYIDISETIIQVECEELYMHTCDTRIDQSSHPISFATFHLNRNLSRTMHVDRTRQTITETECGYQ